MRSGFLIRKANTKDLKDILRLSFELFKKEHQEYDKSLNLKWTYVQGKKYFKNRIVNKDGFMEIAESNGRTVAYLCGGISARMFYREKARYAELENMFIEERFRRKGIGTKLTRDFVDWCKKKKVKYVAVTASNKNRQGLRFYRDVGFKDYNVTLEMKISNK